MKKTLLSLVLSFGLVGVSLAECGPTFGPGGSCTEPPPEVSLEKKVIPYFSTLAGHSSRFGITNPLDFPVLVNVGVFSVEGVLVSQMDVVIKPKAILVSSLSEAPDGSTYWFIPEDDVNCKSISGAVLPITEGYLEITSQDVPSFGPGGFCSGNYELQNPNDLFYEYSVWEGSRLVNDQKEAFSPTSPVHSSWTANQGRSTSVALNKTSPGCEQVPFTIFSREGLSSSGSTELCGKVVVISVGPEPFFTSKTSNTKIFENVPFSAGWINLNTSGTTLTIRSEF